MEELKKKCKYCGKTLVPIGDKRTNGKQSISDWKTREYHKTCYKMVIFDVFFEERFPELK